MNEVNYIKSSKELNEINISKSDNQLEENQYDKETEEKNRKTKKNIIKTRIYLNEITPELLDEIQNSAEEIEEWEKIIIMLAICDKTKNINRAKQILAQNKNVEGLNIKDVNRIMNQIKAKKNIFDFNVYDKILGWELDEKLLDENRNIRQEIKKVKHEKEEVQIHKVDAFAKSEFLKRSLHSEYEISEEKVRRNRVKDGKNDSINKNGQKGLDKIDETKIAYKKNKKDIESEIRKIKAAQKKIYIMLQSKDVDEQKKAIKLWDISEYKLDKLRRQLGDQER